jgi:hypothetical protein
VNEDGIQKLVSSKIALNFFASYSHSIIFPFAAFFVQKIPFRSWFKFLVLIVALDVLWVIFSRVEIGAAVEGFNLVDVMIFEFNTSGKSFFLASSKGLNRKLVLGMVRKRERSRLGVWVEKEKEQEIDEN